MNIIVSQEIESVCPGFVGACVEAEVKNTPFCQPLWEEIKALGEKFKAELTTERLKDISGIAATRRVYRYSIGGFDADKYEGDTLTLGVGREGEPYEGIGRGIINIAGLPIYRDARGGVGTPTSDNERTKIDIATTHLMVLINGYDGCEDKVRANAEFIQRLLRQYAHSDGGSYFTYR